MEPALAFSHSAKLCVSVSHDRCSVSLIYYCLSSYISSNIEISRMSKPRQRQMNIRAKAVHVTDCVFLPAHTTSNEQGYTQFVHGLIGSEAYRVCSRGGNADKSDGGDEDGRAPVFFLSHQIQRPLSGIGSPHRSSSPPEKRIDAPPVFLPRGGQGGR